MISSGSPDAIKPPIQPESQRRTSGLHRVRSCAAVMLPALTLQVMLRLYGHLDMAQVAQQTDSGCPSSSPAEELSDSLSRSGHPHSLVRCVDGKLLFS